MEQTVPVAQSFRVDGVAPQALGAAERSFEIILDRTMKLQLRFGL